MYIQKSLLALSIIATSFTSNATIEYQQGTLPTTDTTSQIALSEVEIDFNGNQIIVEKPPLNLKTLTIPIIQEKKQNSKKLRKGISSAAASTNSFSASSCIGFNLGTGIYGQLDYAGQEKCYFTNVSETTKLEALLINLPSGVNYDFYMLKYDSSGVYPTLDFSTNTSNTNEFTYSVVDPGSYLLIVKGVSGFSSSQNFIIGALGHSDYDQFEANDRANIATALTGNTISSGNLDNNGDFDYFAYTFESNQTDSRISFDGKAFHQL